MKLKHKLPYLGMYVGRYFRVPPTVCKSLAGKVRSKQLDHTTLFIIAAVGKYNITGIFYGET